MNNKAKMIAFIGAGNMAEAIMKGILAQGLVQPEKVLLHDISQERLDLLAETYGVRIAGSLPELLTEVDLLFLAVKPQQFPDILPLICKHINREKTTLVSIAAGITLTAIEDAVGEGTRVVRVMPNTPALVGAGAAALCGGRWVEESVIAFVEELFRAVGVAVRIKETDFDAVTAVSGSGPAYIFLLIEAMQHSAEKLGLQESTARALILATVEGAAKMCDQTGEAAGVLRERVTSKGGTTAAALAVMNDRGLPDIVGQALTAASDRSKELSGSLS